MDAIKARGLSRLFGEKHAVRGLDLSVPRGELFALLGTNGAGKTTAIKMLSTLLAPSAGSASIEGLDICTQRRAIREIINVSPQETAIAPNLTVRETLEFFAGVYAIPRPAARIAELVERFGLGEVLSQKGKTLSGGWQRRLSIALALINSPRVLFLDEPTLGLDVLARKELWRAIRALRGEVTVILTTHYMEEAEQLADRVGILHRGELIALGTPGEIKQMAGCDRFEDAFAALVTGGEL